MTTIGTNLVGELRAGFRGTLLRPGEDGYDEARRVWSGAVDRRPALIARCAGAEVQLRSGLGQHREDASLHARDHSLDRVPEIHWRMVRRNDCFFSER